MSTMFSSYGSWSGELLAPGEGMLSDSEDLESDEVNEDLERYIIKMCNELLDD